MKNPPPLKEKKQNQNNIKIIKTEPSKTTLRIITKNKITIKKSVKCITIQVRTKKGNICKHKRKFLFSIIKLFDKKIYAIIKLHFPPYIHNKEKLRPLF